MWSWIKNRDGYYCLKTAMRGILSCTVGRPVGFCPVQQFSSYYLTGINSAITDIPTEALILCTGYKIGDMQFGITGSCYFGESEHDAAMREIHEELGITFDQDKLKFHSTGITDNVSSTIFSLCLNECDIKSITKPISTHNKDNRNKKVAVIIFGSSPRIKELMELARPQNKTEQIAYFASVPKRKASNIINIVKNNFLSSRKRNRDKKIKEKTKTNKRTREDDDF